MRWVETKGVGAGGGFTPSRSARGHGGALEAPPSGCGAEPQKLCKLCVINVLNDKEFHQSAGSPPKNHGNEFEIAIVHLKCLLGTVRLVIK